MFETPLNTLAARLINHLLQSASWAMERLRAHSGNIFVVRTPAGSVHLQVAADGLLEPAPSSAEPAVRITLNVGQWLRVLARDRTAVKDASIEGDAQFAEALRYIAEHLEWDYEEDLSYVVGDVAAHRIALGLRQAQIWRKDTAERTAQSVKEYLTEEKPLIASREAVQQFKHDVEALRDEVERLTQRIEKLLS